MAEHNKMMDSAVTGWDSAGTYHASGHAAYSSQSAGEMGFTKAAQANNDYKANEMRHRAEWFNRSDRSKRAYGGGILALNGYTGDIKWFDPAFGDSYYDHGFKRVDTWNGKYYVELGLNLDVTSSAITQTGGKKILLVGHKSGVVVYDITDNPQSRPEQMRNDLISPNYLACWSNLIVDGGTYYHTNKHFSFTVTVDASSSRNMVSFVSTLPKRTFLTTYPVEGNPIVDHAYGIQTITAVDVLQGTHKWIRKLTYGGRDDQVDAADSNNVGGVGVGRSIITGSFEGHLEVINKADGRELNRIMMVATPRMPPLCLDYHCYSVGGFAGNPGFGFLQLGVSNQMTVFTPYGK
jgi:hypothetical protein